MILEIEQLGPVRRAEIDLGKDLLLLTGPNATGKTHVAWAVYEFLQAWRAATGPEHRPAARALFADPALQGALTTVADHLLVSRDSKLDRVELLQEHGQHLFDLIARRCVTRLAGDLAAAGQGFDSTRIEVSASEDVWAFEALGLHSTTSSTEPWSFVCVKRRQDPSEILIGATRTSTEARHLKTFQFAESFSEHVVPLSHIPQDARAAARAQLAEELAIWLIESLRYIDPVIFPAERAAILSPREPSAQQYPRPIQDHVQIASNLARWSREQSEFADLAEYLEQHLLHGSVRLSQDGALTFVPDPSGVTLGMHTAAPAVTSLGLLVFYLRHRARTSDFLIIDEPDLHLDPASQRLLARVLARAVNRGLKVLASTHSDHLVHELNSLILPGQDTAPASALRQKHGYAQAELLLPSQLGVYLFRGDTPVPVPPDLTLREQKPA